jgi:hypothetical protein
MQLDSKQMHARSEIFLQIFCNLFFQLVCSLATQAGIILLTKVQKD